MLEASLQSFIAAKTSFNEEAMLKLYDRFTFDAYFKLLRREGFDHEEALEHILNHCSLSALTFRERIENGAFRNITADEYLSPDLQKLIVDVITELGQ